MEMLVDHQNMFQILWQIKVIRIKIEKQYDCYYETKDGCEIYFYFTYEFEVYHVYVRPFDSTTGLKFFIRLHKKITISMDISGNFRSCFTIRNNSNMPLYRSGIFIRKKFLYKNRWQYQRFEREREGARFEGVILNFNKG